MIQRVRTWRSLVKWIRASNFKNVPIVSNVVEKHIYKKIYKKLSVYLSDFSDNI